jgi:hypothetical protein
MSTSPAILPDHLSERTVAATVAPQRPGGEFVLYRAHHAPRAEENPALDAAATLALQLDLPLLVYQGLGGRHRYNSNRHPDTPFLLVDASCVLPMPRSQRRPTRAFQFRKAHAAEQRSRAAGRRPAMPNGST